MGKFFALLCFTFLYLVQESYSHGRFMKPLSRSSLWRDPDFLGYDPPKNYNDNELFCGGIHQADNPGTNCGVCGDPASSPAPRPNEVGGELYRGIITGKYQSGQVIEVAAEITAEHSGYMEWRLCADHQKESQKCFDQHVLQREDGGGSRLPVTLPGWYRTEVRLPAGVKCDHCVIQWNYRAGNNWGVCEDGTGKIGCGAQETFRGCSDVKIT